MIRYTLVCDAAHSFEGWFRNSDDFEAQCGRSLVVCPDCGSTNVGKSLMAPAVSTARKKESRPAEPPQRPDAVAGRADGAAPAVAAKTEGHAAALVPDDLRKKEVMEALRVVRNHILQTSENVGAGFAEEARKIHYGEAEERSIYGQTSLKDAQELLEEGISVVALPDLPDDKN
ncbi:DUF1178 family protein [Rhodobacterales bacterium]|nr:DUF1178 family protein [Rhodobacterales bacterium]